MHLNQKGLIFFQRTLYKVTVLVLSSHLNTQMHDFYFFFNSRRKGINLEMEKGSVDYRLGKLCARGVGRRIPKQKNIWNVLLTLLVWMWQG